MLRFVGGIKVTNISENCSTFIFRVKQSNARWPQSHFI